MKKIFSLLFMLFLSFSFLSAKDFSILTSITADWTVTLGDSDDTIHDATTRDILFTSVATDAAVGTKLELMFGDLILSNYFKIGSEGNIFHIYQQKYADSDFEVQKEKRSTKNYTGHYFECAPGIGGLMKGDELAVILYPLICRRSVLDADDGHIYMYRWKTGLNLNYRLYDNFTFCDFYMDIKGNWLTDFNDDLYWDPCIEIAVGTKIGLQF